MKIILTIYVLCAAFVTIYGQLLNGTDEIEPQLEPESRTYTTDSLNLVTLGVFGDQKRYLFSNIPASWYEAMYFCDAYGMDLAKIEDEKENNLIQNHIVELGQQNVRYYWIGGHSIGRATFAWMNGESIVFSDWDAGEPNEVGLQHCMALFNQKWRNNYCHDFVAGSFGSTGFICEERLV